MAYVVLARSPEVGQGVSTLNLGKMRGLVLREDRGSFAQKSICIVYVCMYVVD